LSRGNEYLGRGFHNRDPGEVGRETETMQRFTLTAEHIALLRRANISWEDCEFGAPAIDCKRPYGNSDVLDDIGEILGIEKGAEDRWGEPDFTQVQADVMRQLHRETKTALQIVLAAGSFEPGVYEADDYMTNWRKAG
jgi:hypothetical protein